ncbi:MAG: hypothetical protein RLZZ116_610, partial [Planctomycetota bacterium]|jgi:hypothetical protein
VGAVSLAGEVCATEGLATIAAARRGATPFAERFERCFILDSSPRLIAWMGLLHDATVRTHRATCRGVAFTISHTLVLVQPVTVDRWVRFIPT